MPAEHIIAQLRRFLLILTVIVCGGTVVELLLLEHTDDPIQLVPFSLAAIGAGLALWVMFQPSRQSIRALRVGMTLVFLGSGVGMLIHLIRNVEFEMEIRPGVGFGDIALKALMGASPLLSPGVLALAAVLAIAATYYHPARQTM